MRIALVVIGPAGSPARFRRYDGETDDVRSILSDLCEVISDRGVATFLVSGFGDDCWPVDVGVDLPVLLEQLPEAIASVSSGESAFELHFYEQGIERFLHFSPLGSTYSVQCTTWTDWTPDPATEQVRRADLLAMLLSVRQEFLALVQWLAPGLASHPWMRAWAGVDPR
jgi:hypothetical protein